MSNSEDQRRRGRTLCGALVALTVVLAACGSDDDSGGNTAGPTTTGGGSGTGGTGTGSSTTAPAAQPVTGGALRFGGYSLPTSLDPIVNGGTGYNGSTEMAAIYDTLVRLDPETGGYRMRTAESVTANAGFTEFTVKLKPGIKFTDGTAYDAEAVAWGLNRHRSGLPGAPACGELRACPRNASGTAAMMAGVSEINVVDPLTIRIVLRAPEALFQLTLASEAAMIPSPTALRAACPADATPALQCPYGTAPVGAGAFKLKTYTPKESVQLERNPSYYGKPAYLDTMTFTSRGDSGGAKTYEAFKLGELDAALLTDQHAVYLAKNDKVSHFEWVLQAGRSLVMSLGATVNCTGGKPEPLCTGKPDGPVKTTPATADIRVRQAVQLAIDSRVHNQRVFNGESNPTFNLWSPDFKWNPRIPDRKTDLEAAKKLVAEAKAAGWNGKIRYQFWNTPLGIAEGLAVQSMLNAVGMDVQVDTSRDLAALTENVYVRRDFDIVGWSMAATEMDGPAAAIDQFFSTRSARNVGGYSNPAVDAALAVIKATNDDNVIKAQLKIIGEAMEKDAVVVPMINSRNLGIRSPKLKGVVYGLRFTQYLDEAWLEK